MIGHLDLNLPALADSHRRFTRALRESGEIAVREFAASTLPGLVDAVGPESEAQGKAAITRDIFKVVIPLSPEKTSGRAMAGASVAVLVSRRRSLGKVRNHLRRGRFYVPEAEMRQYEARKHRNVGIAASGYLAAANALGVTLPAWIAEHHGEGSFEIDRAGDGFSLVISNQVPWVSFLPDAHRKSGYVVQAGSGRFHDLSVEAFVKAARAAGF